MTVVPTPAWHNRVTIRGRRDAFGARADLDVPDATTHARCPYSRRNAPALARDAGSVGHPDKGIGVRRVSTAAASVGATS